ncbi:hypothetical protein [Bacillus sp. GM_Baccil_2]|uniref:hypothetical protein n=1 Tax=Bacillus sp. GM_Baccil_2 TaxID=2937369 RepID=UPI00226A12D3
MELKDYPHRFHVKRVLEKFINPKDSLDIFKENGILINAFTKKDIAKIGADFYFSREQFLKFKNKIESENNYKKSSRINIPSKQVTDLKEALISAQGAFIDDENTQISVLDKEDGTWMFEINYTEYKPGMIDLLDRTARKVTVTVDDKSPVCNLDFDISTTRDHKKISQVLNYIHTTNPNIQFDFSEINLNELEEEYRIKLFDIFFQHNHNPWKLEKIVKLKVKRYNNDTIVSSDNLKGINSAILGGQNLIDNNFVKSTIKNGFYFSMATMRFENSSSPEYIDLAIEFKSRPEKCETKILASGVLKEENGEIQETKHVFDKTTQDTILFTFKNALYKIFNELKKENEAQKKTEKNNDKLEITSDDVHFEGITT